jgi:hypothetical protein
MTKDEYKKEFDGKSKTTDKKEKALEYALDIRKFEIELYWKRATYFWTFIAAALAGYAVIQRISDEHSKGELSLLLVCLGVIFSLAWYLVNRGSKFWQNNWERHVDMLEDVTIGPLYKIILSEEDSDKNILRKILTDAGTFSVTKINQILSFFILMVWVLLFFKSYYWSWYSNFMTILTITTIYILLSWTKSSNTETSTIIHKREMKIK